MKPSPVAVIALTSDELGWFFPGELAVRLRATLPEAVRLEGAAFGDGDWARTLRSIDPEIIVSGWQTPAIPTDLARLRYVCHATGSLRRHVPRALLERGVLVSNWGEAIAETVAESALTLTLAALRRTQFLGDVMHRRRGWDEGREGAKSLFDRRVGIHGFGAVVRHLLPMLRLFRCPITIYTEGVPDSWYGRHDVRRAASLEELFSEADILIEAEALTPERHRLITEVLLRRLPADAVFVNVGRGAIIDEAALARVAAEGRIRVAVDVYDVEPLPTDSALRGLQDVTLSPHVGGPTEDRLHLCGRQVIENLELYLAGRPLKWPVTLAAYDRAT